MKTFILIFNGSAYYYTTETAEACYKQFSREVYGRIPVYYLDRKVIAWSAHKGEYYVVPSRGLQRIVIICPEEMYNASKTTL